MAYAHLRTGETRAISRRRADEDGRLLMSASVNHNNQLHQQAQWEQTSNRVIHQNNIKSVAKSLEKDAAASLSARRSRLLSLLLAEDEQYRLELTSQHETSQERATRKVAQARVLKQEREQKRQEYADQQYERQWKMSCDDLRTIDSEYFKLHCNDQVIKQIQDKLSRNESLSIEEAGWAAQWEKSRLAREAEETEAANRRKTAVLENRLALREQVASSNAAREAEAARIRIEKEELNALLTADAAQLRAKAAADLEKKRLLQRDIVRYNEQIEAARLSAAAAAREAERASVQSSLESLRMDTLAASEAVAVARRDMHEYRTYLAAAKSEEAAMESMMEAMVAQELARENEARDKEYMAAAAKREKLMKSVLATREQQLVEKKQAEYRAMEERLLEKRAHEWEQAKVQAEEEEARAQEKAAIAKRKKELLAQMDANAMKKYLEDQRAVREKLAAEQQEEEYRIKLQQAKKQTIESAKQNYGLKHIYRPQ